MNRTSKGLALLALATLMSSCLGSCFGSSTPKEEKFYNLRGPRWTEAADLARPQKSP